MSGFIVSLLSAGLVSVVALAVGAVDDVVAVAPVLPVDSPDELVSVGEKQDANTNASVTGVRRERRPGVGLAAGPRPASTRTRPRTSSVVRMLPNSN
ncbi:MAG: hypothetical protein IPK74_16100 [Deltaproteobacteria bacterium]|nr:hypothetical protein [Deltaproteobacteria bacterium]